VVVAALAVRRSGDVTVKIVGLGLSLRAQMRAPECRSAARLLGTNSKSDPVDQVATAHALEAVGFGATAACFSSPRRAELDLAASG